MSIPIDNALVDFNSRVCELLKNSKANPEVKDLFKGFAEAVEKLAKEISEDC